MATLTTTLTEYGSAFLTGTNSGNVYVKLFMRYTEQDIANKRTYVEYKISLYYNKSDYAKDGGANSYAQIAGTNASTSKVMMYNYNGGQISPENNFIASTGAWVTHKDDGTGSATGTATARWSLWNDTEVSVTATVDLPPIKIPYNVELSSQRTDAPETEVQVHMSYDLPDGVTATALNMYFYEINPSTYEQIGDIFTANVTLDAEGYGTIYGLTPDYVYYITCSVTANGYTVYPNNENDDNKDAYRLEDATWSIVSTATRTPMLAYSYFIEEDDIGDGPWKIIVDLSESTIASPNQGLDYKIASIYGTEVEISESKSVFYNIPEETEMFIQIGVTARSSNSLSDRRYDGTNLVFVTPAAQANAYTRQGNSWSLGKVYFKTGDTWVKAKKIYVKEGGVWKEGD